MQKIDSIEIKNFKSIRHQKIEGCKRVNVFIGYPNVGKSNILEAIGLLTFIRQKRPDLLKGLVRFEKLTQLFNYFNIQNPAIINFNENYSLNINYEDEEKLRFNLSDKRKNNSFYDLSVFGLTVGNGRLHSSTTDGVDNFSGHYKELQKFNVKPYKFIDSKIFNESFSALELKVPFGKNMFELIVNNSQIQKEFSELLKPYGLDLVIDISNNDVKISPPIKNGIIQTIPISLMAETLIRVIFFKTAILSSKDSILLFEEPEAHMFPPYIANFTTDIIFDQNNNQYFIATHSPFVLNDFMEDMDINDLSLYAVGLNKGETVVRRLNDDEISEINQYGIDLFFNLESYLKDGFVNNA
jgi:AAA15 family ATPase/GTPase